MKKNPLPTHITLGLEPTPLERRGSALLPIVLAVAALVALASTRGCDADTARALDGGTELLSTGLDNGTVS